MNEHIFMNNFYQNPPLPTWSYEVQFLFDLTKDENAANRDKLLQKAVQSIKIAGLKVETMDVYFAGYKKGYQAKPTMNGQLQIKFNDNSELVVREALEEIFQKTFNPEIGLEQDDYSNKSFTFDIIVRLKDPFTNSTTGVCKYYSCFIQSISEMDFDYKGDDTLDVTATINYKYFKFAPWNTDE